jgi:60 kDa SS-A/Ro ribonucleoprotein
MANKNIFKSAAKVPVTPNVINEAGGTAYSFSDEHALAQYVVTGCMNNVYYSTAEEQVGTIVALASKVKPEFLAKLTVYARQKAFMKDSPALLLAVLSGRDTNLFKQVAPKVLDNAKMVRNFAQIMRSGVTGRKSFGTAPKNAILNWFNSVNDFTLFRQSVGNDPSIADLIKMVHPKPSTPSREALYAYFLGKDLSEKFNNLPKVVQDFENFKAKKTTDIPDVPFEMLTALSLTETDWVGIAKKASWTQTRMNLNTFARHGVFNDKSMIKVIADRLSDKELIKTSKVFPYQLMAAYVNSGNDVPEAVRNALQSAMEVAIENIPELDGKIYVLPDVSGSMGSSVTGYRQGSTSAVRCVDVAALVAASFLRKNPDTEVIPFDTTAHTVRLNSRDSVMTNAEKLVKFHAEKLVKFHGGGTNCAAPLAQLNANSAKGDLVVFVSDNQSWINSDYGQTHALTEWKAFQKRNPNAKLVCIDLQPYGNTQVPDDKAVMNIGGFSDTVFDLVSNFSSNKLSKDHWTNVIEGVVI